MKTVTITQEQLAAALAEWEQASRDGQWTGAPEDSPTQVGEDCAAYLFPLLEQKTA